MLRQEAQYQMNIEHKYIDHISGSLIGFRKRDSSFIFQCPYCQNETPYRPIKNLPSNKLKGSFYWKHGPIKFKCHKCGTAKPFHQFLQEHFPQSFLSYAAESGTPSTRWQQSNPQTNNPFSKQAQASFPSQQPADINPAPSEPGRPDLTKNKQQQPKLIRYCRLTPQQQAGAGAILDQHTARSQQSWHERQADLWLSTDCWHIDETESSNH